MRTIRSASGTSCPICLRLPMSRSRQVERQAEPSVRGTMHDRGLKSDLRPLKLMHNPPKSWLWAAEKLGERFPIVNFRAVTTGPATARQGPSQTGTVRYKMIERKAKQRAQIQPHRWGPLKIQAALALRWSLAVLAIKCSSGRDMCRGVPPWVLCIPQLRAQGHTSRSAG